MSSSDDTPPIESAPIDSAPIENAPNDTAPQFTVESGLPEGAETAESGEPAPFTFYFDIGSAYAWLIAERIAKSLPEAEWQPVLQHDVDDGPLWDGDTEKVYDFAQKFGVLRPVFDDDQLFKTIADSRKMMLAATYAKTIGRTVAFSLAAFRQIFNAAKAVDHEDTILIAAAACEMHPRAVLKAIDTTSTSDVLKGAGAALLKRAGGPTELPVLIGTAADGTPVNAVEDELFALALREFGPLKP